MHQSTRLFHGEDTVARLMQKKVVTILGARPQFIKAAPVSRALATMGVNECIVHTGQHFDAGMSDIFFEELSIPAPRHHLGISGGSHGDMTGRMMQALEPVIVSECPSCVIVYGDTNSTLAGALAAAKLHVPVVHVEAGLRSFNRRMPEEINRVLTDHVSSLLLCPTFAAVENLAREGIRAGVHHIGDVMYDATLDARERARKTSRILDVLGLASGSFALATIHRAENTDSAENLSKVLDFLRSRSVLMPVVLPLHPRTRKKVEEFGLSLAGLRICKPVGYLDMVRLLENCAEVLTDSGGLQKEAYFHRKPCITLRDETEWGETIAHGWNRLWTVASYEPRTDISEYGTGNSARMLAKLLIEMK